MLSCPGLFPSEELTGRRGRQDIVLFFSSYSYVFIYVNQSIHPVCRAIFYLQRYALGSVRKVSQEILLTFFQQVISKSAAIFVSRVICYLISSLLSTPNIQTYPITRISTCQHKAFTAFRKRYSTGVHSTSRSVNERTHLDEYSTIFCQSGSRQLAFRKFPDAGIRVFRKLILPCRISIRFIEIRQLVCIDFTP